MSQRMTTAKLTRMIERINELTHSPMQTYRNERGKFIPQVGNFHLNANAKGVYLCRLMGNEQKADYFGMGGMPKQELANMLHSFTMGLELLDNAVGDNNEDAQKEGVAG